jgi:multidrug efflux pump
MLTLLLLVIALNFYLIDHHSQGFFPAAGYGSHHGRCAGPQDASFPVMNNSILQLVNVIKADPAVDNVIAHTGGSGASNSGSIYIALKPLNVRKVSAPAIINRLRPKLNGFRLLRPFLQAAQDLRIGGRSSNALYQYTIQSDNVRIWRTGAPSCLRGCRSFPDFRM